MKFKTMYKLLWSDRQNPCTGKKNHQINDKTLEKIYYYTHYDKN